MRTRIRKALPYLALLAIVVGFVNFFGLLIASETLYQADPDGTAGWARIHGATVAVTHPLAIAGMAYLLFRFIFPGMMAGSLAPEAVDERVRTVRTSGAMIASARTGGRVGELNLSGPLLGISVFPGGIVLKPALGKDRAILASEFRGVATKGLGPLARVEITHEGVDARSPVLLYGSPDGSMVRAIKEIARGAAETSRVTSSGHPTRAPDGPAGPPEAFRTRTAMPQGIEPVLNILGVVVGIALVLIVIVWFPPDAGPIRFVFAAFVALITVVNLRRFLRGRALR